MQSLASRLTTRTLLTGGLAALLLSTASLAPAAVTWPASQLLPSFSTPAATQDHITLNATATADEQVLFASLKGVVNATQPRIFSYEGDALAEGPTTWLSSL